MSIGKIKKIGSNKQFPKYGKMQNIIYYIYNVYCTDKYINIIAVIRGYGTCDKRTNRTLNFPIFEK